MHIICLRGAQSKLGAKQNVVYDFLKNATFWVKSEAIIDSTVNFLSKNVYFSDIRPILTHKKVWHKTYFLNEPNVNTGCQKKNVLKLLRKKMIIKCLLTHLCLRELDSISLPPAVLRSLLSSRTILTLALIYFII